MKIFFTITIAIVAAAIIAGLFVVGSPNKERLRRFDDFRLQHLQQIQSEVITYWQVKNTLPERLSDIADPTRGIIIPKDPQTGADYEYEKTGELHFTLCTSFNTDSKAAFERGPKYAPYPAMPYPTGADMMNQNWDHGTGRTCFDRTIDSDFYRPSPKD